MSGNPRVSFDRAKLGRLRIAHDKAVAAGLSQFEFEGNELLVSYARYLIEYLETVLPNN